MALFVGDGKFQKGFDSRRGKRRVELIHGMSIAELAQLHSHDAVNLLVCVCNNVEITGEPRSDGKKYPTASRVAAATKILEYAHGKPESLIKIQQHNAQGQQSLSHLTTDRLIELIEQ